MSVLYFVIQLIIAIGIAPFLTGIIKKLKALSQHRIGIPLLQPYYDLAKLFKKDVVRSKTASWIYTIAPYIYFSTTAVACLFIPFFTLPGWSFKLGDALLMAYLLALGRFFITLAALDTGSTFGGMGSSREVMVSVLMEPALILSIFALGSIAGSTGFDSILNNFVANKGMILEPIYIFTFIALFIILLAETCRMPIDDPSTHLELTMIHEAMILEYSGRDLALIEWASSIKQFLFISILVRVFLPFVVYTEFGVLSIFLSICVFLLLTVLVSLIVGFVEINLAKLRLFKISRLSILAFTMSMMAALTYFVSWR